MSAQMSFEDFTASVAAGTPPAGVNPALLALWHGAAGQWDRAHELAQAASSRDGDWVHAYLHRKEGDPDNARYWYRRAGRAESGAPLTAEWDEIVQALLGAGE